MAREIHTMAGNYYHVMNRGNLGSPIFKNFGDRRRFLLALFLSEADITIEKTGRIINSVDIAKREIFEPNLLIEIKKRRFIKIVAFAMMDNHFHLLIEEGEDGGIARFMQKFQNSYTKYYNARHSQRGHLFQGPYKIVPVTTDEQMIYLSAYIHRNPRELPGWADKEDLYPWSSCRDYLGDTDWQGLLEKGVILDQMENGLTYKMALINSAAKEG